MRIVSTSTCRRRREEGFTLVELLVAMTVFAIISSAAGYGLESALAATAGNSQRIVASSLVSQELDSVEATPFTSVIHLNGRTTTSTTSGVLYTVTDKVQAVSPPASPGGTCNFSAAGTDGEFLVVNVMVSWSDMRGVAPATGQVELSPPASAISAGYASQTIQITGGSSTSPPVAGISILSSGANPQTEITDSNGCAFFTDLLPGIAYRFTSLGGYIDQTQADQNSPPTATWTTLTALAANSAPSQQLVWDLPAVVTVSLAPPSGDISPTGGLSAVLVNLQAIQAVNGASNDTLSDLTNAASLNVFPFSSGWRTWAGSCAAADPDPAASGNIATLPGGAVTGYAPLFTAAITTSTPLTAGQLITAVAPADTGCAGQTLTYAIPGGLGPFNLGLPWGTWTFTYPGSPGSQTSTMTAAGVAINW